MRGDAVVTLLSKVLEVLCLIIGLAGIMATLPDNWNILLGLPCLAIALSICVFVHEVGHLAGALSVRWKVVVFAVGRFALQIPNRSFGIVDRKDREEIAGWVVAFPPDRELATIRRALAFTACGPLANLLFALVLAIVALNLPQPENNFEKLQPVDVLFVLAWLSMGLFLGNAIPRRDDKSWNDGAKIVDRIRQNDGSTGVSPLVWMLTLLTSNLRLRDLPVWMVEDAALSDDQLDQGGKLLMSIRIGRALDAASPDVVEVRELIDDYHSRYDPSHWSVACEAFLAAVYEADVVQAKVALARVDGTNDVPQLTLAAQAAIAMRDGRVPDGRSALKEMNRLVRKLSRFTDLTYRDIHKTVAALQPVACV
jgi:hypothetical protein